MSNYRFPASLKPIVSKGYSYQRGGNVYRSEVAGGLPRQGRDTFFDTVPFTVTLVTSALGNQTFQLFLNKISGGADSFVMALDSGLGVKDHQCQINSAINIDTSDDINWTISFSLLAERTDIQEDVCLTANLPDLFGCYGDGLNCFLDAYATAQTTFPRVREPNVIAQFNASDRSFVGIGFSRASEATYRDGGAVLRYAAVNEPRYEGDGLLIEPSSTNFVTYGQDLSNTTWVKSKCTASSDALTIIANGYASAIAKPSTPYDAPLTLSVDPGAISTDIDQLYVQFRGRLQGAAVQIGGLLNMKTGVMTSAYTAPLNMVAEKRLDGSYRFSLSTSPIQMDTLKSVEVFPSSSVLGLTQTQADITGGIGMSVKAANIQLEVGYLASSYIPTNGSALTRAADILTLQMQGAKRVYREYTPLGSTTHVAETVPYAGELCPPGHVRVIKVLND